MPGGGGSCAHACRFQLTHCAYRSMAQCRISRKPCLRSRKRPTRSPRSTDLQTTLPRTLSVQAVITILTRWARACLFDNDAKGNFFTVLLRFSEFQHPLPPPTPLRRPVWPTSPTLLYTLDSPQQNTVMKRVAAELYGGSMDSTPRAHRPSRQRAATAPDRKIACTTTRSCVSYPDHSMRPQKSGG